jgi:hypothetical protein
MSGADHGGKEHSPRHQMKTIAAEISNPLNIAIKYQQ